MGKRLTTMAATIGTAICLAVIPSTALAKTCRHHYVHAVIGHAQKCLHAGEFCSHSEARQYRRYGFACVRYRSGYYHLRQRG